MPSHPFALKHDSLNMLSHACPKCAKQIKVAQVGGGQGSRGCRARGSSRIAEPQSPRLRNRYDIFFLTEAAHVPSAASHRLDHVLGSASSPSPSGERRASHPPHCPHRAETVGGLCPCRLLKRRCHEPGRGRGEGGGLGGREATSASPTAPTPATVPSEPPDPGHDCLSAAGTVSTHAPQSSLASHEEKLNPSSSVSHPKPEH